MSLTNSPPSRGVEKLANKAPSRPRRITLNNIVKEYHTAVGLRRVLDGITFDIAQGEKIAVLGKNGAGKSTLVKIIGGVEKRGIMAQPPPAKTRPLPDI